MPDISTFKTECRKRNHKKQGFILSNTGGNKNSSRNVSGHELQKITNRRGGEEIQTRTDRLIFIR